ncbi:hypothetical protein DCC85_03810 [Paenibacillus sp. CAA11]|uniref:hypothetical protein n=1 Tax=Paenibacillus sp. CAA11 TaxID=1532905 RepID=UPI000D37CDF8|nr:hypothetical protein [Paenibacillus sp. CAA11]AWB43433.1 hypothetical protein DCC85_03810 [Paenibacillus sp. CAA11]
MNRIMFVTTPNNWEKLKNDSENIWPLRAKFAHSKNFEIENEILVYLSKKAVFAGVIKVKAKLESSDPFFFSGDVYECKLPVVYDKILSSDKQIPIRDMLEQLEITRGKRNWGCVFQRSMVRLKDEDFNFIRNKINNCLV